ncbi:hypothetical protein RIF29_40528 [Crotalaria pallida]|uniref:Uncharacterized protein n=1 Tax=Crotalaria pallida TaxID=3830 RepID=A0AAN9E8Q4_CROPI
MLDLGHLSMLDLGHLSIWLSHLRKSFAVRSRSGNRSGQDTHTLTLPCALTLFAFVLLKNRVHSTRFR